MAQSKKPPARKPKQKLVGLRSYARHRGVVPSSVEEAVSSGRIQREPSGLFDIEACDVAWAANTDRSKVRKPPPPPPRQSQAALDKAYDEGWEEGLRAGRAALAEEGWLNMVLRHIWGHARLSLTQLYGVSVVLRWHLQAAAKIPTPTKLSADVGDLNWPHLSELSGEAVDLVAFEKARLATMAKSEARVKQLAKAGEK